MAKKQFIRHLEYYGFPDQNQYSSEFTGVDLSDIREKNREQDEEIDELEGEKADKSDLIALSREVDSLIDAQSEFNEEIVEKISGITSDIEKLKEIDNEYGEQLSALTDSVNDVIEDVNTLDDRVDNIEGDIETLSSETEAKLEAITSALDDKLDKEEAEETYAKKEDCVTKEYLDEKLEDYATKEWVEEQNYLTVEEGDERYAKKEDLSALSESIEDLEGEINAVSGDLQTLSSTTNDKIDAIETTLDSFEERISGNEESIENIENELSTKANQSDLEDLESVVSALSETVDTKVGQREFERYKTFVSDALDNLDEKKADKTGLTAAMDAIESLDDRLDQEIADRIAGDEQLQNEVDGLDNELDALDAEVDALAAEVGTYNDRISAVESGLTQEIADRKQADLDLIGHETDDMDDDTIWAAKKYAKYQGSVALADAKEYTDNKATEINSRIDQEHEWAEQNFSSAASKSYVNDMVNALETELEGEIETAVQDEKERAQAAETDLLRRIIEVLRQVGQNKTLIDRNANQIHTITAWDGEPYDYDPEYYDDSGNGILDVLHREFHEFEETAGAIKEIRVEDGNLIIVYYTKEGEKEIVIPVAELIDLSNYYTKAETDERIEEAIEELVLDNYYTKEETDEKISEAVADVDEKIAGKVDTSAFTEVVEDLDGRISDNESGISVNASAISSLFDKLGYTNNETLVTNNNHEVAFGEYNISNTSEDPSGQTIFSIGNGTDDENRSNAVEVRKDGSVYLWIEGDFMNINLILAQIAHEIYDGNTNSEHNTHFFDGE